MSTTPKSSDGLKDAEWEKGHLSNRPPIPYVPVVDIVTPKKDPQVYKVKLPADSHISMHIYSRGNNEEYLTHIVADMVSSSCVVQYSTVEDEKLFF
jgi:hypothetical protein